jgi:hypothetical protein
MVVYSFQKTLPARPRCVTRHPPHQAGEAGLTPAHHDQGVDPESRARLAKRRIVLSTRFFSAT